MKDLFAAHGLPQDQMVMIDETRGRVTATTVRREIRIGDQRFSSMEEARAHLVKRFGEVEGARLFEEIERAATPASAAASRVAPGR